MGRVSAIVGVVVCVVACAACTRGGDTASSGSTSGADDAARTIAVYLARDGKVAPVRRVIHAPQEEAVSSALDALTRARPTAEERSAGYVTAVPPRDGDVEVAGGVARVVTGPGRSRGSRRRRSSTRSPTSRASRGWRSSSTGVKAAR